MAVPIETIPLEELLGDLIDARVDARTCRIILQMERIGRPFDVVPEHEILARMQANVRQVEVITAELARRGIAYKSAEACP